MSHIKIESSCGQHINIVLNDENCVAKSRKHCGKRRKCWLPAHSPFPYNIFESLSSSGSLKAGTVWQGVMKASHFIHYQSLRYF